MAGDTLTVTYQPYMDAVIGAPPPPGWAPAQPQHAAPFAWALPFVCGVIVGALLCYLVREVR